ncbi:MAG: xanthine dehydrogenase accessory protein XdhC, partial [Burkholderiales bacterium]|nr:xanthine dehydrogenase accessory protein XdhC [Burkholderiales bacterium]
DEVLGTIGGGHLEWQAIARARALAVSGAAADEQQVVALGPTLGQCCGGSLTLRYRPLAAADPASWPEPAPRFTLQLYGAGHVGRAIARLLAGVECRVQWIDEREAEFPPDATSWLPPHIERLCAEPVEAEVAQAPPGCRYLVLTHSHALDLALAEAILRRGDFGWFGLIGSRSKRARFEHRLTERGFDPALIARIVCPIGLPGIAGKEPEVIAIAVVAQLLQCSETERQYGPVPA